MSKSKLYGLKRPDRKATVELEEASFEDKLKTAYSVWLTTLPPLKRLPDQWKEEYVNVARKIISPFKDGIKKAITDKDFDFTLVEPARIISDGFFIGQSYHTSHEYNVASLFMDALLHEGAEELSLNGFPTTLYYLCNGLAKKTIKIGKGTKAYSVGEKAKDCMLSNSGEVTHLGNEATDCDISNSGKAEYLGHNAKSCNILNSANAGDTGDNASESILLNIGKIVGGSSLLGEGGNRCTIYNSGEVGSGIGKYAEESTVINKGTGNSMGDNAGRCSIVNCGKLAMSLGHDAQYNTIIDLGKSYQIGGGDSRGNVMVCRPPEKYRKEPPRGPANKHLNWFVGPDDMKGDDILNGLLDVMEGYGNGIKTIKKADAAAKEINELAREVHRHVCRKYQPRKVA